MPDIFLSYSRVDQVTARRFADAFAASGVEVWWDTALRSGQAYDEITETALKTAKAVVVLWSKTSVASRWVRAEATQADRNGTLVPVMIEACERPIMFELTQTADLSHWQGAPDDAAWRSFLADVHGFLTPRSEASQPPPNRSEAFTQTPPPVAQEPLLAVLAFDNLSGDADLTYFSDGISEDILDTVARSSALKVVARSSSFQFRGADKAVRRIAADLKATHLLDGSVRRSGTRVRIAAQLVDCGTATTLWSSRFDRELTDVFALQDEIALEVAAALKVALPLATRQAAIRPEAYDHYLHARALSGHPDGNGPCLAHLEAAVSLSPDFAAAWASLAMARAIQLIHHLRDANPNRRSEARCAVLAAAERASELDPELGLPYVARAHLEPPAAYGRQEALLDQARRASPDDLEVLKHSAEFVGNVGRVRENFDLVSRAHRSDPLNRTSAMNYCVALADVGLIEESYEAFEAARARWPEYDNLLSVPLLHAALLGDARRLERCLAAAADFTAAHGETRSIRMALGSAVLVRAPLAQARGQLLAVADRQLAHTGAVALRVPLLAHHLGLRDEAFEMIGRSDYRSLREADGRRPDDTFLTQVIFGVTSRGFRSDARFVELCSKLGLSDYWLESDHWPDCADEVAGLYDFRARVAASVQEGEAA